MQKTTYAIKKILVNFLCSVVPSKKMRHQIRDSFLENNLEDIDLLPCGVHRIEKRALPISFNVDEQTRLFWTLYANNRWENFTFEIFDRFIDSDSDYLDIGAWIGPTALYGASRAKNAYAFEPDKLAFEKLNTNRQLNPQLQEKLHIFNFGIGECTQKVKFFVGEGATSTSSIVSNKYNEKAFYHVDFFDIRTVFADKNIEVENLNFIKIDIEGGEYKILPSIIDYFSELNHYPTLFISTHAPFVIGDEQDVVKRGQMFEDLNAKLLETLKCYPNLYVEKSKITTASDLGQKPRFFDILATNHPINFTKN